MCFGRISRPVHSTALPSLQILAFKVVCRLQHVPALPITTARFFDGSKVAPADREAAGATPPLPLTCGGSAMGISTTPSRRRKASQKPYREFSLTPHRGGKWMKKIRGKIYYFGRWAE